jgi:hypothetical protein
MVLLPGGVPGLVPARTAPRRRVRHAGQRAAARRATGTALFKRWLLGTHQGRVDLEHLQSYLDEFCFRFNRRHPRARGMLLYRLLQYAAAAPPLTYHQPMVNPRSKKTKPTDVTGPVRSRAASPVRRPTARGACGLHARVTNWSGPQHFPS